MPESSPPSNPQWQPHAAVAGWLLPGLGHMILGQKRRGMILCVSILSLWLAGMLIGGISVIDQYDRPDNDSASDPARSWWFIGQGMIAPSFVVDLVRNRMEHGHAKDLGASNQTDPRSLLLPVQSNPRAKLPPYEPSFGRVAEQGVLYTALAGMLNLLAMIDVLYCDPKARLAAAVAAESNSSAEPVTS